MDAVSRTAAATAEHSRWAAHRAVDDPAKLAKAARVVRAALARNKLNLTDLTPLDPPAAYRGSQ
jgi:hypothetical protein